MARVDVNIVSRLLRDNPRQRVSLPTKRRILEAVDALECRPNTAARAVRAAKSGNIGQLIPDLGPVYVQTVMGAKEEAAEHGFAIPLASDGLGSEP